MKGKILALMAVMIISVLAIGTVFAYQLYGNRNNTTIAKVAAENAVESGDYASWKALHANSNGKMVSLINEGNFYLLKEMHEAKEAGNFTKVQEIKTEIGFNSGNGQDKGMQGQGKNRNNGKCPYAN